MCVWVSEGECVVCVWVGASEGERVSVYMRAQPKPGNTCLSTDQPPLAGEMLEATPQRRGCRTAPHPAGCVCAKPPNTQSRLDNRA